MLRTTFEDTLMIRKYNRTESTVVQCFAVLLRFRELADPVRQFVPFRLLIAQSQGRIALFFSACCAPLASIVYTRETLHTKRKSINKRQMVLIRQDACDSCHIMIIDEGQVMLSFLSSPFFWSKLLHETVNDLEHVHAVEA